MLVCLRCDIAPREIGKSFCDDCHEAIISGRPFITKVDGVEKTVRLRPNAGKRPKRSKDPRGCDVEGCSRIHEAKGLCILHYKQKRRGETPKLKGPGCFFCEPSSDEPLCEACRADLRGFRLWLRERCSSLAPL